MNTNKLIAALAVAFVAAGCAKIAETENSVPQEENQVTILATLEQDPATKTVLNPDGTVYWQPGDQIAVFFNSVKTRFTSYNKTNAASAYFVGNTFITTGHNENSSGDIGDDYTYWGLYPYYIYDLHTLFYDCYKDEDRYSVYQGSNVDFQIFDYIDKQKEDTYDYLNDESGCTFAKSVGDNLQTYLYSDQFGAENTFDHFLNIAIAKSADYKELAFYNVLGGIRFTVNADNINRVTFRGNNNEDLAGHFSVTMDSNDRPVITDVDYGCKTISVSPGKGKTFKPGVWYYAMMFPTNFTKGYTIECYTASGKAEKVVNTAAEVKRSVFGSIAGIDDGLSYTDVIYPKELTNGYGYGITFYLYAGETRQATEPYIIPDGCTFPVVWRIADTSIATIDENGVITGKTPGETRLYAIADQLYLIDHVRVLSSGECNSLHITSEVDLYGIYEGTQVQLTAVPDPATCPTKPVWSSDDESVATVDQNGLLTAVSAGYTRIRARIGNVEASEYIYVEKMELGRIYEFTNGTPVHLANRLVYATSADGFIIGDGATRWQSDFMYVKLGATQTSNVKKGDRVTISGQKGTIYNTTIICGAAEDESTPVSISILSSGNDIPEIEYVDIYRISDGRNAWAFTAGGYAYTESGENYIILQDSDYKLHIQLPDFSFAGHESEFVNFTGFSLYCDENGKTIEIIVDSYEFVSEHYETVSVQDVLNGTDDEIYRVSGYITYIANTSYGNVYIADTNDPEAPALYIYGLYDWYGYYPKDRDGGWDGFGIQEGSYVTVQGPRTTFGATIELKDATLILPYSSPYTY